MSKKYTCFCCGVQFEEFKEYKEHIIEEHDEGRDFVICPLERCQTPVRDLRLHFKVKHPSQKCPTKTQIKATIWRDKTPGKDKLKTRKPKFREGYYESIKMEKSFKYRSGYECTVFECLDSLNEIQGFDVEPFEISYIHKGEAKKYIPDIFISYHDGRKEIWEIKPTNQTHLQKNKDKWFAANEACKLRGWKFKVITEKGIEKLKKKVREQLI